MHRTSAGAAAIACLLLAAAFAPLPASAQVVEQRQGTVSITLVEDDGSSRPGGGGGVKPPGPDRVTAPPGGDGGGTVTIVPEDKVPELGDLPKTGGDANPGAPLLALGAAFLGGALVIRGAPKNRTTDESTNSQ